MKKKGAEGCDRRDMTPSVGGSKLIISSKGAKESRGKEGRKKTQSVSRQG